MGLLTVGMGVSMTLLPALGTLSLPLGCLINLYTRAFALSSSVLFCHDWLLSPEGNCGQYASNERRIRFQLEKGKKVVR